MRISTLLIARPEEKPNTPIAGRKVKLWGEECARSNKEIKVRDVGNVQRRAHVSLIRIV